jgi:hypothetical protein
VIKILGFDSSHLDYLETTATPIQHCYGTMAHGTDRTARSPPTQYIHTIMVGVAFYLG